MTRFPEESVEFLADYWAGEMRNKRDFAAESEKPFLPDNDFINDFRDNMVTVLNYLELDDPDDTIRISSGHYQNCEIISLALKMAREQHQEEELDIDSSDFLPYAATIIDGQGNITVSYYYGDKESEFETLYTPADVSENTQPDLCIVPQNSNTPVLLPA